MIHVWLALDPETCRVTMQDQEFGDGNFPAGLRGLDWPIREAEIPEEDWEGILSGAYDGERVNDIHRTLWTANGATPWPHP